MTKRLLWPKIAKSYPKMMMPYFFHPKYISKVPIKSFCNRKKMCIWGKVLCIWNQTKRAKMPHSFRTKFGTSVHSARPSWHSSKMTCIWSELAPPIRLSLEACLPIPFQLWEQGCFLVCCLWRQMPKVWVSQTLDCTVYRLDSNILAIL